MKNIIRMSVPDVTDGEATEAMELKKKLLIKKYSLNKDHHMMRMYMLLLADEDWKDEDAKDCKAFLKKVIEIENKHKTGGIDTVCCGIKEREPIPYFDTTSFEKSERIVNLEENSDDEETTKTDKKNKETPVMNIVREDRVAIRRMRKDTHALMTFPVPALPDNTGKCPSDGCPSSSFPSSTSSSSICKSTTGPSSWMLNLFSPEWEPYFAITTFPECWSDEEKSRIKLLQRFFIGLKNERQTQLRRVTRQDMSHSAVKRFTSSLINQKWKPTREHNFEKEVSQAVFPGLATYAEPLFKSLCNMNGDLLDYNTQNIKQFEKTIISIHKNNDDRDKQIDKLFKLPVKSTSSTELDEATKLPTKTQISEEIAQYCITKEMFEKSFLEARNEKELGRREDILLDKGWLDIDNFLIHCTFGYEDDTSTFSFPIQYAITRVDTFRKMQTCWVLLIPYILLYIGLTTSLLDRPSGYYLIQNVNEHVGNDEILTAYITDEPDYFPMVFSDIANADDFWAWAQSNLVNYAFSEDGGVPGWNHKNGGSNHIIGALRFRSVRQDTAGCIDRIQEKDWNDAGVCKAREGTGDPLEGTGWFPTLPQYANEGGGSTYGRPLCLAPKFEYTRPLTSKRTVNIATANRPNSLVAAHIFKYLVEDRLEDVVVNLHTLQAGTTIRRLLDLETSGVTIDAAIALWVSDVEQETVVSSTPIDTSDLIQLNATFGPIDMSTWMSRSVSNYCPMCATNADSGGWAALQQLSNNLDFTTFTMNAVSGGFYEPTLDLGWTTPYSAIVGKYFVKKDRYLPRNRVGGSTYGTYVKAVKEEVLNNKNIVFYGDDALGRSLDALKLKLDSEIPVTSTIRTYIRQDVKTKFADVYQLLHKMTFTTADRDSFFESMAENDDPGAAACAWVTANEQRWHPWIRTATSRNRIQRSFNYNYKCFDVWGNSLISGNKDGWINNANVMNIGGAGDLLTAAQTAFASGRPASVTSRPGVVSGTTTALRKYVQDVANKQKLSTGFFVPTREEFALMRAAAAGGETASYEDWSKREGWVFRSCEELLSSQVLEYYGVVNPYIILSKTNCGGYSFFLPISKTKNEVHDIIDSYRLNDWIDVATRTVIVEFFVHAQNTGHFARFQYTVEFASEGVALPSTIFVTFELYHQDRLVFPGFWWVFYILSWLVFSVQVYGTGRLMLRKIRELHLRTFKFRNMMLIFRVFFSDIYLVFDVICYVLIIAAGVMRLITFTEGLTSSNFFCIDVFPEHLDYVCIVVYFILNYLFNAINELFLCTFHHSRSRNNPIITFCTQGRWLANRNYHKSVKLRPNLIQQ